MSEFDDERGRNRWKRIGAMTMSRGCVTKCEIRRFGKGRNEVERVIGVEKGYLNTSLILPKRRPKHLF
jgi:hypothetical protein